jgi:CelD/BcsL family acetyltransferase involved in cellulose biosynthesis
VFIAEDLPGMAELAAAWDRLSGRGAPMQHYIWARACAEVFGGRPHVVAVESLGEVVAIAPLVRRGVARKLEFMGVAELYEPLTFLYADVSALDVLVQSIAALGMPLDLQRMPAESRVLQALQEWSRGLVRAASTEACAYIELGPEWKNPESQFNSGRRSDFRRAERHARTLGDVSFEVLAPRPDELERLLDEAYGVEAAGWKGERRSALALNPSRGAFFRRYAAAAVERGLLRLCFMRIGGHAVAMQLAVECAGCFWLFKIGYDQRFARCSPGTLLMLHTVKYAAERALHAYEFLGGKDAWTQAWTHREKPMVRLRSYPPTPRGMAAFCTDAVLHIRSRAR